MGRGDGDSYLMVVHTPMYSLVILTPTFILIPAEVLFISACPEAFRVGIKAWHLRSGELVPFTVPAYSLSRRRAGVLTPALHSWCGPGSTLTRKEDSLSCRKCL